MKSMIAATTILFLFFNAHGEDAAKKVPVKKGYEKINLDDADPKPLPKDKNDPSVKFVQSCENPNGVKLFENDPGFEACLSEKAQHRRSNVDARERQ